LAGALLHDIGKIEEYSFIDSIEIAEIGNLAGHIALGYYLVRRAISRMPDFPSELATQLLHLILSHHGRNEWGSPVEPATAEALVVSSADLIDAQLFQLSRAGEDFPAERVNYSKSLNRWVLGNPHLPSQESYSYN
jgi:3'-5' exoribonuclease